MVQGQNRPVLDVLDGAIDDTVETLTLKFGDRGPGAGGYLEINSELFYVVSDDDTEIETLRARDGSTAASHADGDIVTVDPRFSRIDVLDAMKGDILAMPNTVFGIADEDVALTTTETYAPLVATQDVIGLLQCLVVPDSTAGYKVSKKIDLDLVRDPDDDLGGGAALGVRIARNMFVTEAQTVNVTYSHRFTTTTFGEATDLQSTVGLSDQLVEAAIFGAAGRVFAGREAARSDTDTMVQPRRAEEVPPGVMTSISDTFMRRRAELLAAESTRLRNLYGWRE
jgi:hypothetical protein